jgi:hypothetical protein
MFRFSMFDKRKKILLQCFFLLLGIQTKQKNIDPMQRVDIFTIIFI